MIKILSSQIDCIFTLNDLRQLEKFGYKTGKLKLDARFLETYLDLGVFPEFLKSKSPNLKVYASSKDLFLTVVIKKLEVKSLLIKTERKFVNQIKNFLKT